MASPTRLVVEQIRARLQSESSVAIEGLPLCGVDEVVTRFNGRVVVNDTHDEDLTPIRVRPLTLWERRLSDGAVRLRDLLEGTWREGPVRARSERSLSAAIARSHWNNDEEWGALQGLMALEDYLKGHPLMGKFHWDKVSATLSLLAEHEGTSLGINQLVESLPASQELCRQTLASYLNALTACWVLEPLEALGIEAFLGRDGVGSIAKPTTAWKTKPCWYLADPLIAEGLRQRQSLINEASTYRPTLSLQTLKGLFIRDLRSYAQHIGQRLYHYEDYQGNCLDAVIVTDSGHWTGFVVVEANTPSHCDAGAKQLARAKKAIEKTLKRVGVENAVGQLVLVPPVGNRAYTRDDGVYVVPMTGLRP